MMWAKEKSIAAILYVSEKVNERNRTPDTICAILYLADKLHLSLVGRTISYDDYEAAKNGTRPVRIYQLMTDAEQMLQVKGYYEVRDGKVVAQRPADIWEFSRTDIGTLDKALAIFYCSSSFETEAWCKDVAWEMTTYAGALFRNRETDTYPISLLGLAISLPNAASIVTRLYNQGNIQ